MMRSLFSGFAGMRTQQHQMDVIGNNIANVNTTGYKAARVNFEDLLYQSIRTGSEAYNPVQIGGGVRVGAIDTLFTQGSPSPTGGLLDLAITGDGFIVLGKDGTQQFTRSGSLGFNKDGYLVHTATGARVMGWQADADGNIQAGIGLRDLRAIPGERAAAKASTSASFAGLFDRRLPIDSTLTRDITVVDALGQNRVLTATFTRTNATDWTWTVTDPEFADFAAAPGGTITFSADGEVVDGGASDDLTLSFSDGVTPDMTFTLDFSTCQQGGGDSSVAASQIGGVQAGTLREVAIDELGHMVGVFSNGTSRALGQLALATFANESGLQRQGSNLFRATNSSGDADTSMAPGQGRGKFTPGSLEMSNVDLTQEFASMILSQRAFQANSRVVTTTDEMLQEVVNLRR